MESETNITNGFDVRQTIEKILKIAYPTLGVIALGLLTLAFLLGTNSFFSEQIGIFASINFIIRLFKIDPMSWYTVLVRCSFAIYYFVMVIVLIKGLIESIIAYIQAIQAKFEKETLPYKFFPVSIYVNVVIFIFLGSICSEDKITDWGIFAIGITAVMVFLTFLVKIFFDEKRDWCFLSIKAGEALLVIFTLIVLGSYFPKGSLERIMADVGLLSFLSSGFSFGEIFIWVYNLLIAPALEIVLVILFLSLVKQTLSGVFTERIYPDKKQVVVTLIFLIVIAAIYCLVASGMLSGDTEMSMEMMVQWYDLIGNSYLPQMILLIPLLILNIPFNSFPMEEKRVNLSQGIKKEEITPQV